ncbi:hypothetical protein, partial [Achromobacter ruhlandii]|uniref:hypothetical protein n=1 Tax=Achromobacter ruhlandii TaxID=72557 RepID=UPI001B8C3264
MDGPTLQAQALFETGQQFTKTCVVDAAASALNYGGDLDVLATPVIVYWIESYATECIRLPDPGPRRPARHSTPVRPGAPPPPAPAVRPTLPAAPRRAA